MDCSSIYRKCWLEQNIKRNSFWRRQTKQHFLSRNFIKEKLILQWNLNERLPHTFELKPPSSLREHCIHKRSLKQAHVSKVHCWVFCFIKTAMIKTAYITASITLLHYSVLIITGFMVHHMKRWSSESCVCWVSSISACVWTVMMSVRLLEEELKVNLSVPFQRSEY